MSFTPAEAEDEKIKKEKEPNLDFTDGIPSSFTVTHNNNLSVI